MIEELDSDFDYEVQNVEQKMQIYIREWIVQCTPLGSSFFHFANEGKTSWVGGKQLKRMGVTAGVSDIFLTRSSADGKYKGLWIELKAPGKKPSKEQLAFIAERKQEGYWGFWSDNISNVIRFIKLFYQLQS